MLLDIGEAHIVDGSNGLLEASGLGIYLDAHHLQAETADFKLVASERPLSPVIPLQSPGPNSVFARSSAAGKINKSNSLDEVDSTAQGTGKNKGKQASTFALRRTGS